MDPTALAEFSQSSSPSDDEVGTDEESFRETVDSIREPAGFSQGDTTKIDNDFEDEEDFAVEAEEEGDEFFDGEDEFLDDYDHVIKEDYDGDDDYRSDESEGSLEIEKTGGPESNSRFPVDRGRAGDANAEHSSSRIPINFRIPAGNRGEKRQVNLIPIQLTNQLTAGMTGTLQLHKYIITTIVHEILNSKRFLEGEATEKDEDTKEMELIESYSPDLIHKLVVESRNKQIDLLFNQAKNYIARLLKTLDELKKIDSEEYEKSRRVPKHESTVAKTDYFKKRIEENVDSLRRQLEKSHIKGITDAKLNSEFLHELSEYENLMRENLSQDAAFQQNLISRIMIHIRQSQSAELLPLKKLCKMPKNLMESTDHAATLQHVLSQRILKEMENSVKENRPVNFREIDLTNLSEDEDANMTVEDLSDRDSFVMPDRVRKIVDDTETQFIRLLVFQLILSSRLEEVLIEMMLEHAAKKDKKIVEILTEAQNDKKENAKKTVRDSKNLRVSSTTDLSRRKNRSSTSVPPSPKNSNSLKARSYRMKMRKISIHSVNANNIAMDTGDNILVSEDVDLAFRRTIANHVTTVKHFIEIVVAKKADRELLTTSAKEALAELNKFLEEHKKAANAAKPPPTPWKPEDEDELLSGESSGGGAGSKKPSESVVAKNGNSAFANESATELISDGRSGAGFESSMQTYEFVERISMGLHKSFKYDYEAEQFDGSEESSSSEGFKPVEDESREDKSDHDLID